MGFKAPCEHARWPAWSGSPARQAAPISFLESPPPPPPSPPPPPLCSSSSSSFSSSSAPLLFSFPAVLKFLIFSPS
eukprot:CAMPEP_0206504538 /NCGR_PEP_ID=MMETSP0324_2-20121206/55553_1 /ASSEMBLY_ACC=CAM_ASM_000836 /TAXON_ID=2866 /ORGANISM="Crypthecodinium cohnii, Strain Seligo" /LENGTH=75 /DNA_ID=CAMNT_0053993743 /DNA_START=346 /DNA_END=570 /DNA_ORIENTATION=+